MNSTINIEALENMKVSPHFAKMLFNDETDAKDITVRTKSSFIEWHWKRWTSEAEIVKIAEDGTMSKLKRETDIREDFYFETCPVTNAFQIVRYIDNYLNSLK